MFKIDNLMESLTGYIEAKVELIKIDIKQEGARLIATAIIYTFMTLLALLALISLTIGLGALLNKAFDSEYLGYLLITVIYLAIAGVIFAMKDSMADGIRKSMLNESKTNHNDNHSNHNKDNG